ncbi:MAG: Unknown protein [uncultured Sulfurovum sp.]|uniref:Terminase small subunit n=1 Tax=uncultured Sulfurovum sp. TaxID=269237 RepID=A0A6S6ST34_9BACT|nr:MAG: Unknown protein [uncultured Sulfurovum sp.]
MNNKLTDKQSRFVEEYLVDLNATAAAKRAGYSKKTAQRIGSENLSKPLIAAAIKEKQDEVSKSIDITREELLMDLRMIKDENKGKAEYPPHALKAIELITRMLGYNAADKSEIKISGEQPLFLDNDD